MLAPVGRPQPGAEVLPFDGPERVVWVMSTARLLAALVGLLRLTAPDPAAASGHHRCLDLSPGRSDEALFTVYLYTEAANQDRSGFEVFAPMTLDCAARLLRDAASTGALPEARRRRAIAKLATAAVEFPVQLPLSFRFAAHLEILGMGAADLNVVLQRGRFFFHDRETMKNVIWSALGGSGCSKEPEKFSSYYCKPQYDDGACWPSSCEFVAEDPYQSPVAVKTLGELHGKLEDYARTLDPQNWDRCVPSVWQSAYRATQLESGDYSDPPEALSCPDCPGRDWSGKLYEHYATPGVNNTETVIRTLLSMKSDLELVSGEASFANAPTHRIDYCLEDPEEVFEVKVNDDSSGKLVVDEGFTLLTEQPSGSIAAEMVKVLHFEDFIYDADFFAGVALRYMGDQVAEAACCPSACKFLWCRLRPWRWWWWQRRGCG
jgi:hypothetical protein